jgi:hypothetical protein
MTSWNPDVHGKVNSIALAGHCSRAWLGGTMGLIEVSTSTGRRISSFRPGIRGNVDTVTDWHGHLLVGGSFPGYYYSLNPATGKHDGFLAGLGIHGSEPPGLYHTKVYNQQLSPNGKRMLAEGDFTSVAGRHREQIFMLNLDARHARLTPWYSSDFNGQCVKHESFYIRSAAWSPDGSHIYAAATGEHALGWDGHSALTGLCDVVAAFPSMWKPVDHVWRNFTGCDSLYSVAATASTVFAGGHQRWINNRNGCDNAGPPRDPRSRARRADHSRGTGTVRREGPVHDEQGQRRRHAHHTGGPVDRQQQPVGLGLMRAGCRSFRHLPAARAGLSGSVSAAGLEVQSTGRLACRLSARCLASLVLPESATSHGDGILLGSQPTSGVARP